MLDGAGIFSTIDELYDAGWMSADALTTDSYTIGVDDSALQLRKSEAAEYEFDDGLMLSFTPS